MPMVPGGLQRHPRRHPRLVGSVESPRARARLGRRSSLERADVGNTARDAADMRRRMGAAAQDRTGIPVPAGPVAGRRRHRGCLVNTWPADLVSDQRAPVNYRSTGQVGAWWTPDRRARRERLRHPPCDQCQPLHQQGYRRNENGGLRGGMPGGGALTIRGNPDIRWSGACISQHRSTNYAHAAAESKRSSRTATPSTCSAPMRWICRCVRPLLKLVTTRPEPFSSNSSNFGADRPQGIWIVLRRPPWPAKPLRCCPTRGNSYLDGSQYR